MTEVYHAVSQFLQVNSWIYQIRPWSLPSIFFPGHYFLVTLSFDAVSSEEPQLYAQSSLYSPNSQPDFSHRQSMSTGYVSSAHEQPVEIKMWTALSGKQISTDKWTVQHSKQAVLLSIIMWADLSMKWSLKININSHIYSRLFQMEQSFQNHGAPDP
jgi:hypothetical protein